MLEDKHSGAKFDLSQLFRLNKAERKFFTIQGASGGPFDHVDMVYDYHFTLCGSVPPTPFDCFGGETIFRAPAYQVSRALSILSLSFFVANASSFVLSYF